MASVSVSNTLTQGFAKLDELDPVLSSYLQAEHVRQSNTLSLVASSGGTDASVLAASAATIVNVTAEGYPGARYHSGCQYVDKVEALAIERAKTLFGASYANVQPHCASAANHIVMHAVLQPGDVILGMNLDEGGHLTHGAKVNVSGQLYTSYQYGLDAQERIDFAQVERLALAHRPKLIVCGTTSYSRHIDFKEFRRIADLVGAYLLADVTHIAGLVAAGEHESPVPYVDFTTMCTFKQLFGPRGGLILMGESMNKLAPDNKTPLYRAIQKSVFPTMQGSPATSIIAAKARIFDHLQSAEFKALAQRIKANATTLSNSLKAMGYDLVTGGTDNHIVLFRLPEHLPGYAVQQALDDCQIMVNKNRVPGDVRSPMIASGIRLGSNTVSLRNMGQYEMEQCAEMIHSIISSVQCVNDKEYELDPALRARVIENVESICRDFPLPYAK
ncbi:serine hydroxymethyltransferase [Pseudoalteromonas viridis]|uniref:Probable serine hydroxymethyltransferase n=1 Tax=Pseudoalteromonas viridis TaxID=339617 RepID=A0ABX7V6Z0_9GAMM|nr:serine hydroxymethyltransferase [Pseudoalteromonas viridis]QTL36671.1 serine hydroxymethyltransferase [Pseudoalteromonas viridis]